MSTPYLFLDIDGVCNRHEFNKEAESCIFVPSCVAALNRILVTVRPQVILSSAWRYMILNGAMRLDGFSYMLRTHGVDKSISQLLVGTTRPDTMIDGNPVPNERGSQIWNWLSSREEHNYKYVVLDDMDLGITEYGHYLVQTLGNIGLTDEHANHVIEYFRT